MLAPQSEDEVRLIVEALRRRLNDQLLDILWNPRSIMTNKGSFDAIGRVRDPVYDGRWEVVRYETPKLHDERPYTRICRVCQIDDTGKYPIMLDEGPYAPVSERIVDYIALWDRAQAAAHQAMAHQWDQHDKIDQHDHAGAYAGHQEALERVYREHGGGEYWMGRGFGPGQQAIAPAPDPHAAPSSKP